MKKWPSVLACALLVGLGPLHASDDPFVGFFSGDLEGRHYRVTIERVNASTYDGILQIDAERMQLDARRYGEIMHGLLRSHSERLVFRARIEAGILILNTEDGRRLILRRGRINRLPQKKASPVGLA